ncbi:MAG: hypothetical protein HY762_08695 [Planctomycetes bacterium]|nr:hypothetical protein [Planctomycetota bacterium]
MANEVKLDLLVTIPPSIEPSGDMPDRWAEGLTNNATRIRDRFFEVLSDEGQFTSRLAEPANQKWQSMLNPGFVSRAGLTADNISQAHYKDLADAYNKFVDKYELAFATVDGVPAKRFKDQVNNSKDNWAYGVAKGVLRITGDRIRGMIVPQVTYWMTGDPVANKMTNHMEILDGSPYDFTATGVRQQFKSAVMSLLVTAGITIIKSDLDAAKMAVQNGRLTGLADRFKAVTVKPFVVGGGPTDSLLQYEHDIPSGALKLHARIVLV